MHPHWKDECVWLEKSDKIYYLVENIACKIKPPVPTKNGLHDCFVTLKLMAICYIISTDILYAGHILAVSNILLKNCTQGIIQKKSVSDSRMLLCLIIFFWNFILIWKCQKWSLNRGTLVSVTKQSALLQF